MSFISSFHGDIRFKSQATHGMDEILDPKRCKCKVSKLDVLDSVRSTAWNRTLSRTSSLGVGFACKKKWLSCRVNLVLQVRGRTTKQKSHDGKDTNVT